MIGLGICNATVGRQADRLKGVKHACSSSNQDNEVSDIHTLTVVQSQTPTESLLTIEYASQEQTASRLERRK